MSERRTGKSRVPRDKMTVAELVEKWKENYLTVQQQLGRLKPSTLCSYQSNLDGHIAPFFGAMALAEVRLASVQEFIKALLGKGLSPKTIGNVIVILKEMFKHAVQWGHLDANPAQYVERPRGEDKEMDVFTPEEIRRLLDAQEEPLRTLLLTAVLTGMRQGELFGLQWEDIDFARQLIHVRRSLWRGTLGHTEVQAFPAGDRHAADAGGRPSRLSTTRVMSLSSAVSEARRLDADNFRHREFPQRSGAAEPPPDPVPRPPPHLHEPLIAHGAHPKYIQAQLGHASIQTTLDRYGHLMPQLHQAEAQKLDQLVSVSQATPPARRLKAVRVGRPRGGAKWEQSPSQREAVGAKWEQKTRKG